MTLSQLAESYIAGQGFNRDQADKVRAVIIGITEHRITLLRRQLHACKVELNNPRNFIERDYLETKRANIIEQINKEF